MQEAGKATHYLNLMSNGDAKVTATLMPVGTVPTVITWTGGAEGADNLQRIVRSNAAADVDIVASVSGNPCATIRIHMIDATAPPAAVAAVLTNTIGGAVPNASFNPYGVMWGHRGGCGDPAIVKSAHLEGNIWVLRLKSVDHVSRTGVKNNHPPRINVSGANDPNVNAANYLAVIASLTPGGFGIPPPFTTYWCRDIVQSHEEFHVTDFHITHWMPRMQVFETWVTADAANIITYDCGNANTVTKVAVENSRQAALQNRANIEHDAAWVNFHNVGWNEVGAHNHSNALLTARIAAIQALYGP